MSGREAVTYLPDKGLYCQRLPGRRARRGKRADAMGFYGTLKMIFYKVSAPRGRTAHPAPLRCPPAARGHVPPRRLPSDKVSPPPVGSAAGAGRKLPEIAGNEPERGGGGLPGRAAGVLRGAPAVPGRSALPAGLSPHRPAPGAAPGCGERPGRGGARGVPTGAPGPVPAWGSAALRPGGGTAAVGDPPPAAARPRGVKLSPAACPSRARPRVRGGFLQGKARRRLKS